MDCFDYPLDATTLLRKKKSIRKELLAQENPWIEKRIAVLGGSTTCEVVDQLDIALLNHGIKADFYQSDYGRYWEDGMFGNETLDAFHPDIIYVHTNWRNILTFPTIKSTTDEVSDLLSAEFKRFSSFWESVRSRYGCPVIQNNFDRPAYRLLGNRDIWDFRGRSNFVFSLNSRFYEYARSHSSFFINDLDYVAQEYGLSKWCDPVYWNMYKYFCPLNAIPFVACSVANIIKSIFGKNKKLLALDLDNTLWGGVVGDDGVEGIKIGSDIPLGQPFYDFQCYCKELQQIGVLLAVNSKNEHDNAVAGLNHPSCVLKLDDFVSLKANWNTKDSNLRQISDELSLGLDSFVFIDDNLVERDLVKRHLPMVSVPSVNSAEDYVKVIEQSGFFESTAISEDDLLKTSQYKARTEAKNLIAEYGSYDEYLAGLDMKAVITDFEPVAVQRVAQLTNKSNQFNLTTLRCSESDISRMQENCNYLCLCGRLTDRFADNGIVTVVAGEIIESSLHIRLWLMSCRVLKRGLEDFMMNKLVKQVGDKGLTQIVGYYYPTPKNGIVKSFYSDMGFKLSMIDEDGKSVWLINVADYRERNVKIVDVSAG